MTRKLSLTVIMILLISLLFASPVSAAKTYRAERFDVQIELQENGSAIVTETVEFRFEGDPFTFAFREISATETDGITFLDASRYKGRAGRGRGRGSAQGNVAFLPDIRRGACVHRPLSSRWNHPQRRCRYPHLARRP